MLLGSDDVSDVECCLTHDGQSKLLSVVLEVEPIVGLIIKCKSAAPILEVVNSRLSSCMRMIVYMRINLINF